VDIYEAVGREGHVSTSPAMLWAASIRANPGTFEELPFGFQGLADAGSTCLPIVGKRGSIVLVCEGIHPSEIQP
jgi:hypothetical protein